eukprot:sb/3463849/
MKKNSLQQSFQPAFSLNLFANLSDHFYQRTVLSFIFLLDARGPQEEQLGGVQGSVLWQTQQQLPPQTPLTTYISSSSSSSQSSSPTLHEHNNSYDFSRVHSQQSYTNTVFRTLHMTWGEMKQKRRVIYHMIAVVAVDNCGTRLLEQVETIYEVPIYRDARGKCPLPGIISLSKTINFLFRGKFILPVNRSSAKSGSDFTKIFSCSKCGYITAWKSALRSHIKLIHKRSRRMDCIVCGFTTRRKRVLRVHMLSHKSTLTYTCRHKKSGKECSFQTRRPSLFKLHLAKHRSRKLQARKEKRVIHQCPDCEFLTPLKRLLHRHRFLNHIYRVFYISYPTTPLVPIEYKTQPNQCMYCPFITWGHGRMLEHVEKNHKTTVYKCPHCDFECRWKQMMTVHVKKHTPVAVDKLYSCLYCSYRTRHKNALYTHVRIHTDDRPYRCHVCDYSAIQKVHLDAHMYKHNGILPYNCSLCKYRTATKASLKAHMCKHTGIRPFKCMFCDYRSARKADLKKHITIRHSHELNK